MDIGDSTQGSYHGPEKPLYMINVFWAYYRHVDTDSHGIQAGCFLYGLVRLSPEGPSTPIWWYKVPRTCAGMAVGTEYLHFEALLGVYLVAGNHSSRPPALGTRGGKLSSCPGFSVWCLSGCWVLFCPYLSPDFGASCISCACLDFWGLLP